MLTDNFTDKQCTVQKALSDLETDEQKIDHLLCKVHSLRIIQKTLADPINQKAREHLLAALYHWKTLIRCEKSIERQVGELTLEGSGEILKKDWANYTQYHSSLLLQISFTNAVKSCEVKADMTKGSFCSTIQHLANVAMQWDRTANKKKQNSEHNTFLILFFDQK